MTSETLRRSFSEADLLNLAGADRRDKAAQAFLKIVERLSDRDHVIDTSPSMRQEIARRATELHFGRRADRWTLGGMSDGMRDGRGAVAPDDRGGASAAKALAVALRETAFSEIMCRQEDLRDGLRLALLHERDGRSAWEKGLTPMLSVFAANARACGASRSSAALQALTAAAALSGEAAADPDDHARALAAGVASSRKSFVEEPIARPETRLAAGLMHGAVATNAARLALWGSPDAESVRRFGAAAARASFHRGATAHPVPLARQPVVDGSVIVFDDATTAEFPEDWRQRFSHVSVAAAREAFQEMAADPRASSARREVAWKLADALQGHPSSDVAALCDHLGYDAPLMRAGELRLGARLRMGAPRGRFQATSLQQDRRGRMLRCRAVADDTGAIVGYAAHDPLSREFGGRPLLALYALDGVRRGYAWGDAPMFVRAGVPEQGFHSAPEKIFA